MRIFLDKSPGYVLVSRRALEARGIWVGTTWDCTGPRRNNRKTRRTMALLERAIEEAGGENRAYIAHGF